MISGRRVRRAKRAPAFRGTREGILVGSPPFRAARRRAIARAAIKIAFSIRRDAFQLGFDSAEFVEQGGFDDRELVGELARASSCSCRDSCARWSIVTPRNPLGEEVPPRRQRCAAGLGRRSVDRE